MVEVAFYARRRLEDPNISQIGRPRSQLPGLGQDFRIVSGRGPLQRIAVAAESLYHAQVGCVVRAVVRQPGIVIKINGLDDERATLPVPA